VVRGTPSPTFGRHGVLTLNSFLLCGLNYSKPSHSPIHFAVTTSEPYAVCCIEGIKVSLGMHRFGEKRFGSGLADDLKSHSIPNTRVVGDFTKSITLSPIVETMRRKLSEDPDWRAHVDQAIGGMNDGSSAVLNELLSLERSSFRRHFLQTRFFELGNNCMFYS
jgi:hypothetical protein